MVKRGGGEVLANGAMDRLARLIDPVAQGVVADRAVKARREMQRDAMSELQNGFDDVAVWRG